MSPSRGLRGIHGKQGHSPRSSTRAVLARGSRELQTSLRTFEQPATYRPPPPGWPGSTAEWAVYDGFLKLGKRPADSWGLAYGVPPGQDFEYQGSFAGGRKLPGGIVPDFVSFNPPNIAIDVQGLYWHYRRGTAVQGRDLMQRAQLVQYGVQMIFIDEDDALRDGRYYVREALTGIDHSRARPGL